MKEIVILLADDDPDDRSFFDQALTESDIPAKLTTVEDGQQLTHFLSGVAEPPPPDIIFLDINMPYKNGKNCLLEIRQEPRFDSVVVVMYSTSSERKDIDETFTYGANMYIIKPASFGAQINMLKTLFLPGWKERISNPSREMFVLKAG
jgi:CheY-like chemotaxis protein